MRWCCELVVRKGLDNPSHVAQVQRRCAVSDFACDVGREFPNKSCGGANGRSPEGDEENALARCVFAGGCGFACAGAFVLILDFASACFFVHGRAFAFALFFAAKRINQSSRNQKSCAAQTANQRPVRDAVERVGVRAVHRAGGGDFDEGRQARNYECRKRVGRAFFGNRAHAERTQRHHEGKGVEFAQRARVDEHRANHAHADEQHERDRYEIRKKPKAEATQDKFVVVSKNIKMVNR